MKVPVGRSNFRELIEEGFIYVDKTEYIEKLEDMGLGCVLFLRPRRFGKSLFISMLSYYYDINCKDLFDSIFGNTYIGKKPTIKRNNYYILNFNFSGIDTKDEQSTEASFLNKIKFEIKRFIKKYNLNIDLTVTNSAADIMNEFLSQIPSTVNIYVMIDEYDHFTNELLGFNTALFAKMVQENGYIRKWYEILKEYSSTCISKFFITGVTPITLDSLTSGFNIHTNMTTSLRLHNMMGFTEGEVKGIIDKLNPKDKEKVFSDMENHYNGYIFSKDVDMRLFNSNMVLFYINKYQDRNTFPEELTDESIITDHHKLENLFDLYMGVENKDEIIRALLDNKEIPGVIETKIVYKNGLRDTNFISLLFYLGMVTISRSDFERIFFKIPNYVTRRVYFDFFRAYLETAHDIVINVSKTKDALWQLQNNNLKPLMGEVEKVLNKISNRDYIKFDEKYVKLIMLQYLFNSNTFNVKSEYEVYDGYIDIALLPNNSAISNYYYVMEVKYLKADEGDKLEGKRKEAIEQISKYLLSDELMQIKNLKKYVIVFVGDKCEVCEEITISHSHNNVSI